MSRLALAYGKIVQGRVVMGSRVRESYAEQIKALGDGPIVSTVERATRSSAANAYLWGVCYAWVAKETGQDPETIHAHCKRMFVPKRRITYVNKRTGELVDEEEEGTTHDMPWDVFSAFIESVKGWAKSDLNITIPNVGEYQEDVENGKVA